jgi:hypothetical protein
MLSTISGIWVIQEKKGGDFVCTLNSSAFETKKNQTETLLNLHLSSIFDQYCVFRVLILSNTIFLNGLNLVTNT